MFCDPHMTVHAPSGVNTIHNDNCEQKYHGYRDVSDISDNTDKSNELTINECNGNPSVKGGISDFFYVLTVAPN